MSNREIGPADQLEIKAQILGGVTPLAATLGLGYSVWDLVAAYRWQPMFKRAVQQAVLVLQTQPCVIDCSLGPCCKPPYWTAEAISDHNAVLEAEHHAHIHPSVAEADLRFAVLPGEPRPDWLTPLPPAPDGQIDEISIWHQATASTFWREHAHTQRGESCSD